jgi:hypothetical protein
MKKFTFLVALVASALMAFAKSDSKVVLTSGSLDFLNDAGQYAYFDVDWTKTKVVEFDKKMNVENDLGTIDQYNQKQGVEWVADWDRVKNETNLMLPIMKPFGNHCWFPGKSMCFNNKNKKGLQFTLNPAWFEYYNTTSDEKEKKGIEKAFYTVDPATAKYKVLVIADTVDMGNGAASAFGMDVHNGGAIMKGRIIVTDLTTRKSVAEFDVNYVKGWGSFYQFTRLQSLMNEIFVVELLPLLKK